MKRLLMTAPLLALLAAPASAQSSDPNVGTGNIVPGAGSTFVWPWPGYPDNRPLPAYVGDELAWPLPGAPVGPCCGVGPYPNPYAPPPGARRYY
jgi:hypothetical protein